MLLYYQLHIASDSLDPARGRRQHRSHIGVFTPSDYLFRLCYSSCAVKFMTHRNIGRIALFSGGLVKPTLQISKCPGFSGALATNVSTGGEPGFFRFMR